MEEWERFHTYIASIAMAPRMVRFGLSFIVGLGCWFGRVDAQTPAPAVQSAPVVVAAPDRIEQVPARQGGPIRNSLHRHGYSCGQNLDWYGCGGCRAQCAFVFGSCRTFFGEPCLPRQPREGGLFGGSCNR